MKIITITFLLCLLSFGCTPSQKKEDIELSSGNETSSSQNTTSSTNTNTNNTNTNTNTSNTNTNTNTSNTNTNTNTSNTNTNDTNTNTNTNSQNTGSQNNTSTNNTNVAQNTGSQNNTSTNNANTDVSQNTKNTSSSSNTTKNTSNTKPVQDTAKIQAQVEQESSAIRKIYQSFGSSNIHPVKGLKNFDFQKHLRFLVQQNAKDDRGYNMLMLASERGYVYTVKSILAINSQQQYVNHQSDDGGKTALMLAANGSFREIVRMLLLNGANPEITRSNGKKAIDFAKDDEIIGMLKGTQRY